ncbi:MAG TPA: hypothetical protein VFN51_01745 [Candidatus Saccharimonadales bacterium]|nr:hypothetical protein [Candidatus Saccharimonadales bacterium]
MDKPAFDYDWHEDPETLITEADLEAIYKGFDHYLNSFRTRALYKLTQFILRTATDAAQGNWYMHTPPRLY